MNNKLLEMIEEYNKSGLFNEPTTVNNNTGAAALLKWFAPQDKTIELSVADTVDTTLVRDYPADIENYIREVLARKIAKQLIEEDLIQIQSDEDIEHKSTTFRARVKVIQE